MAVVVEPNRNSNKNLLGVGSGGRKSKSGEDIKGFDGTASAPLRLSQQQEEEQENSNLIDDDD